MVASLFLELSLSFDSSSNETRELLFFSLTFRIFDEVSKLLKVRNFKSNQILERISSC